MERERERVTSPLLTLISNLRMHLFVFFFFFFFCQFTYLLYNVSYLFLYLFNLLFVFNLVVLTDDSLVESMIWLFD